MQGRPTEKGGLLQGRPTEKGGLLQGRPAKTGGLLHAPILPPTLPRSFHCTHLNKADGLAVDVQLMQGLGLPAAVVDADLAVVLRATVGTRGAKISFAAAPKAALGESGGRGKRRPLWTLPQPRRTGVDTNVHREEGDGSPRHVHPCRRGRLVVELHHVNHVWTAEGENGRQQGKRQRMGQQGKRQRLGLLRPTAAAPAHQS